MLLLLPVISLIAGAVCLESGQEQSSPDAFVGDMIKLLTSTSEMLNGEMKEERSDQDGRDMGTTAKPVAEVDLWDILNLGARKVEEQEHTKGDGGLIVSLLDFIKRDIMEKKEEKQEPVRNDGNVMSLTDLFNLGGNREIVDAGNQRMENNRQMYPFNKVHREQMATSVGNADMEALRNRLIAAVGLGSNNKNEMKPETSEGSKQVASLDLRRLFDMTQQREVVPVASKPDPMQYGIRLLSGLNERNGMQEKLKGSLLPFNQVDFSLKEKKPDISEDEKIKKVLNAVYEGLVMNKVGTNQGFGRTPAFV